MAKKNYTTKNGSPFSDALANNIALRPAENSKQAEKTPIEENTDISAVLNTPSEEKKPKTKKEEQKSSDQKAMSSINKASEGLAASFFDEKPERSKKTNRSFYIEEALYEKLQTLAKNKHISISEALNVILEKVL